VVLVGVGDWVVVGCGCVDRWFEERMDDVGNEIGGKWMCEGYVHVMLEGDGVDGT